MEEINTILGYENSLKIIQRKDSFRFSLDSTLLSFFAKVKKDSNRIIDLGSGSGSIPLFMSMFTDKKIFGLEIQKEAVELSRRSIALNGLESQISIINGDIKEVDKYFEKNSFGLVLSNPPYFKVNAKSFLNDKDSISISRHELLVNLEDIVKAASYLLHDGGSLTFVQSTDRLMETMDLLKNYRFAVKRLRFVYPMIGKESYVFMIDAFKNSKTLGLKVLAPLYIFEKEGLYSKEVLSYFHYGEDNEKK